MFSPHTSGGLIGGNGGKMAKRSLARFQRGRFEISEIVIGMVVVATAIIGSLMAQKTCRLLSTNVEFVIFGDGMLTDHLHRPSPTVV